MLVENQTIGKLLKQQCDKNAENKAIGWIEAGEVKSLTFKDYLNQIQIISSAIVKIGLNPGDKLAILGQTSKDWHFMDMATMLARGCVVPVYPSYLPKEVDYIYSHSESSFIVVDSEKQLEKIISLIPQWRQVKAVVSLCDMPEEILKKIRNLVPYYTLKELRQIGADELKTQPDFFEEMLSKQTPNEIASIIYTSGTTGEPKGAVISQKALTSMLYNVEKTINGALNSQDKSLVFLPLSHVLGRCDSLLPLIFGWQAVYAESMEKLLENIQLVKPTIMISVPRVFEKIYAKIMDQVSKGNPLEKQIFKLAVERAQQYYKKIDQDLSPSAQELLEYKLAEKVVFEKIYQKFGGKIRYFVSGGAPLSHEIINFLKYANLTILEGYGLTETIAPCCLNPLSKQITGTVGRPLGDVQVKFAEDGEILIKTTAMFQEYYKNEQATKEALSDGWFHTGDIGEFTPQGFLKITDRKKDLIITSGGKNVAPQKIENMAKAYPHISHFIVIGEKRNYLTALVGIEKERFLDLLEELDLPASCSVQDLANHPRVQDLLESEITELNKDLAQFENIKKFKILPIELTTENFLTPSLKIKRKLVAEQYKETIEALYQ